MAKFEVAFVKREVLFTRYYIEVDADSAEEACRKVEGYDTTPEEDETIVEGKCLGMGGMSHIEEVEWAHEMEKEDA
jgi:hypothetical protein